MVLKTVAKVGPPHRLRSHLPCLWMASKAATHGRELQRRRVQYDPSQPNAETLEATMQCLPPVALHDPWLHLRTEMMEELHYLT